MFVAFLSTSFNIFQLFKCLLMLIISTTFIIFQQFQRFFLPKSFIKCQHLSTLSSSTHTSFNVFQRFQNFQCISTDFIVFVNETFPFANLSRHRLDSFARPAPDGEGMCQHTRCRQDIKGYLTYRQSELQLSEGSFSRASRGPPLRSRHENKCQHMILTVAET
jgi:hypothetical protein